MILNYTLSSLARMILNYTLSSLARMILNYTLSSLARMILKMNHKAFRISYVYCLFQTITCDDHHP